MTKSSNKTPLPPLTEPQAKQAWDAVCAIYQQLGQNGRHIVDPDHALHLAQAKTGLLLIPQSPSHGH